jgi:hypothetical protein
MGHSPVSSVRFLCNVTFEVKSSFRDLTDKSRESDFENIQYGAAVFEAIAYAKKELDYPTLSSDLYLSSVKTIT